ncbi:hypothetical protein CA13_05240 [Planctomycetes bacterium CA13]|uniref:Uncharacterized protein n=1 Tax=Novipirellula herctigrandis TaxID=2527986 RepID=A0A5C5YWH3_9BACT|nr:hypothetical protein CA13_05240 [Planctomycetes bacterium CA13]
MPDDDCDACESILLSSSGSHEKTEIILRAWKCYKRRTSLVRQEQTFEGAVSASDAIDWANRLGVADCDIPIELKFLSMFDLPQMIRSSDSKTTYRFDGVGWRLRGHGCGTSFDPTYRVDQWVFSHGSSWIMIVSERIFGGGNSGTDFKKLSCGQAANWFAERGEVPCELVGFCTIPTITPELLDTGSDEQICDTDLLARELQFLCQSTDVNRSDVFERLRQMTAIDETPVTLEHDASDSNATEFFRYKLILATGYTEIVQIEVNDLSFDPSDGFYIEVVSGLSDSTLARISRCLDYWLNDKGDQRHGDRVPHSNETISPVQDPVVESIDQSALPDDLYPDELLMIWGGKRYERLTKSIVKVLRVFVDQYRAGFPIVTLKKLRDNEIHFDGSFRQQAFKLNRKAGPKIHPVAELIESVADGGGSYRLKDPG